MLIGNTTIDQSSPTFVIAEIGLNHNGSLDLAMELVEHAAAAGANCAKFQMRNMEALYRNGGDPNDIREDVPAQYVLEILSKFQLNNKEMFDAFDHCKKMGILPLCTPWDLASVATLEEYGMPAYKTSSADLTNHDLISAVAQTGRPMLVSTGMSIESEIEETVAILKDMRADYVLLHSNATYPTPFKDVNLNYLERLRTLGDCVVGYSGHERGLHIPLAAVALGARVIEKHLTTDRALEGNDHKISLLPSEFKTMVANIRQLEESMGVSSSRMIGQGEQMNRQIYAKSLIANREMQIGEEITKGMVDVKGPGEGLQPNRFNELVGRTSKRNMNKGDFFFASDLVENQIVPREYNFRRPWGIPVRFHDFEQLRTKSNMDFLEFHLSYKDMEQDISKFFDEVYDLDLVVHSPYLFQGDHLLDLASADENYRKRSVRELGRVIELTKSLLPYFGKATRPSVIVSAGGSTEHQPVAAEERWALYERVALSLAELDTEAVNILPQTLPPFPWYFGGQRFSNIFVDPEGIARYCEEFKQSVCLDISHSALTVNERGTSFHDFVRQVGPFTSHLHIVDAGGVDGEGLQIGDGDIDFPQLAEDLSSLAPNAAFIPEIWQGHRNGGEGFWTALERLERWF